MIVKVVRGRHDQNTLYTYVKNLKNKCVKGYICTCEYIYICMLHVTIIITEDMNLGEERSWVGRRRCGNNVDVVFIL